MSLCLCKTTIHICGVDSIDYWLLAGVISMQRCVCDMAVRRDLTAAPVRSTCDQSCNRCRKCVRVFETRLAQICKEVGVVLVQFFHSLSFEGKYKIPPLYHVFKQKVDISLSISQNSKTDFPPPLTTGS